MSHVIELHTRRARYLQTAGEETAGTPARRHQRLSLEGNRTGPNKTGQGLLMLAHARQKRTVLLQTKVAGHQAAPRTPLCPLRWWHCPRI